MAKQDNMVTTPWGRIRPGETVIVTTSQRKPKREWNFFHQITGKNDPTPIKHLGTFLGIMEPRSRETSNRQRYPELDSYVEIQTMPGVRTQIPFSNIDSIV